MTAPAPRVQILLFEGCPHGEAALELARAVAERLGPGIIVERVEVDTEAKASALGFVGSPSIRVNGEDVEGRTTAHGALACRTYAGGLGLPAEWMVEAAILRALRPRGILFLCVANSARSQLAEGLARAALSPDVRIWSAGSRPTSIRPEASIVLRELGIELSGHRSKAVTEIPAAEIDTVITLCAEEECPLFLGKARRLHWGLPDPAAATPGASPDEVLQRFRVVRDELRARLARLQPQAGTAAKDQGAGR